MFWFQRRRCWVGKLLLHWKKKHLENLKSMSVRAATPWLLHGTFLLCQMASPGHQPVSRQATETARETPYMAHQVHDNFYNENLVLHSGIHWYFLILVSGDWVIKHWHSRRCFSRQITEKIPRPQVYREMNRVWCPRLDLFRQMRMVMKLWQLTGVARSLMNFGYPPRK